MRIKKLALISAGLLFILAVANLVHSDSARASDDPVGANFFEPELIMNHQSDIDLKDSQRQSIIDEIKKTQSNMIDIQFKMKAATQDFIKIVSSAKVDEAKAVAALQKLTKIEIEMKTMHVALMVRIKNTLSKEQQEKLRKLAQ